MKAWRNGLTADALANKAPPPTPLAPSSPEPRRPEGSDGPHGPANLYNGMIAPLLPFPIKGVIWYQGEANARAAAEYAILFPDLIRDWRRQWGQGDFPFLFVQLASYNPGLGQDWPLLRESQAKTLSLPQTGMATAVDIGDPGNIHPPDKRDVGHRLALIAEHLAYGKNVEYSGATYSAMQVQGNTVTLTFDLEDGGLVIGHAPWTAADAPPIPTDHLVGFTIAGADQQWHPADAKINRGTVVVSSPQVPTPVAVRYDWADAPQGNLYNQDGLPAYPFRTDNWAPAPPGGNTE
jgi:sialate O-acetylesterase